MRKARPSAVGPEHIAIGIWSKTDLDTANRPPLNPAASEGVTNLAFECKTGLFRANRGPRPSVDDLVSVDGLAFLTKMKTFWVIKYLNIYSTNK